MKGGVPATLHLKEVYAALGQGAAAEREALSTGGTPEGDHRLVLHQEEKVVRQLSGKSPSGKTALEVEHSAVGLLSQVIHDEPVGHAPAPQRRALRASMMADSPDTPSRSRSPFLPKSWLTGMH